MHCLTRALLPLVAEELTASVHGPITRLKRSSRVVEGGCSGARDHAAPPLLSFAWAQRIGE
jgi:hypothetical protein